MKDEIKEIAEVVNSATEIPVSVKRDIVSRLESLPEPLKTDVWIYRMVVGFLGVVVLITVLGGILLTWKGGNSANYQIPQGVIAIGSAAIGALAGLLAPSPKQ